MDILNNEVLTMLIKERKGPCLSIYTPTHREWNEINQDMIRFKNQIKAAERTLSESGMNASGTEEFLQPAYRIAEDREFWNHQREGLALFITRNESYYLQLPFHFREEIYLNKRFYTKHLLPVFNGDRDFFILSLDVHNIRLFRGYHYQLREINLENIPVNIEEALGLYGDAEKKMQYRAEISAGNTQKASFHGHGSRNDAAMRKRDILRFFEMVNNGIMNILHQGKSPLVLAGVDYEVPIYREANKYPYLSDEYLKLDADFTSEDELFERTNKLLDPHFNSATEKDIARYYDLKGSDKISNNPADIVKAGYENRIAILFVDPDEDVWGSFDIENYNTIVHNHKETGDEDLIDLASTQTLLHNGKIYTLGRDKMPDYSTIAAIYRF